MTRTTARRVEKEWRSSALAGMTSTPPGNRARSASSAPGRSGVELVPGHQLLDAVCFLLLLEPVRVGAVLDLRLLLVLERARGILLEDLVPDGVGVVAVLRCPIAHVEGEDLVLEIDLREHPARIPTQLAALLRRGAVLRELLRDLREVRALVELGVDVPKLLQLIRVLLEVTARGRERGGDLDPRDTHLLRRRRRVPLLRSLRVLLAQQLVACPGPDLFGGYPVRVGALHELVL